MAMATEKSPNNVEEEQTFEELGLDPRLIRALTKKAIDKPTPIQRVAIPLILVSFHFSLHVHNSYILTYVLLF